MEIQSGKKDFLFFLRLVMQIRVVLLGDVGSDPNLVNFE